MYVRSFSAQLSHLKGWLICENSGGGGSRQDRISPVLCRKSKFKQRYYGFLRSFFIRTRQLLCQEKTQRDLSFHTEQLEQT